MLNATDADRPIEPDRLKVIEGITFSDAGRMNTSQDDILANIRSAIRRGHAQVRPQPTTYDRIALVGGGPSLAATEQDLRDLYFAGAQLVTVNGAYHWCVAHNLMPKMQIVLDARPGQARFVQPAVPRCRYVVASQCHPETWDAVAGRQDVWIFHAVIGPDTAERALLDEYYAGQWYGVGGGTTVATRAITLLRMLGYLRFDLFGVDSCWMGDQHHAYEQPENSRDRRLLITAAPPETPDADGRQFSCAPWHLKQAEDFLAMLRINGQHFKVHVHGDGLIAYMLQESATLALATEEAVGP